MRIKNPVFFFTILAWCLLGFSGPLRTEAAAAEPLVEKVPSRPNADAGPTEVLVSMWLIDIDNINSAQQNFTANAYLFLQWKDPRLAHGGKGLKRYNVLEVWTPRMQIANEIGLVRKTMMDFVDVQGDGTCTRRQRYVGIFSQKLDLRNFPFDQHRFLLHFVSTGNGPDEVRFSPFPAHMSGKLKHAAGISPDISLPDWTIINYEAKSLPYVVTDELQTAGYAFEFTAKRDSAYFMWKVIFPLILIVMMSWVAFWIDPKETGTNVTAVMTAMLTLVAYRFTLENYLPKIGYLTRMDRFVLWSTILVFCSLFQVVANASLVAKGHHNIAVLIDRLARFVYPVVFILISLKSFVF